MKKKQQMLRLLTLKIPLIGCYGPLFLKCEFFTFQQKFITLIKGMYKQAKVRVMANGNILEAF